MIGEYIQRKVGTNTNMWVDNGLFIELNSVDNKAIMFRGKYWQIKTAEPNEPRDYCGVYLDNYKGKVGYKEYSWVLQQISLGKSAKDFYQEFMPSLVDACKGDQDRLRKELQSILIFGYTPKEKQIETNKIIDTGSKQKYSLNIYIEKTKEDTQKKKLVVKCFDEIPDSLVENKDKIIVYGFDAYKQPLQIDAKLEAGHGKLVRTNLPCFNQVFQRLVAIKNAQEAKSFQEFTGLIHGDYIAFSIDGRLYIGSKLIPFGEKEIADNSRIRTLSNNSLYFDRVQILEDGIIKKTVYCYNIAKDTMSVVKIDIQRR